MLVLLLQDSVPSPEDRDIVGVLDRDIIVATRSTEMIERSFQLKYVPGT
jgi:hypothetical protein